MYKNRCRGGHSALQAFVGKITRIAAFKMALAGYLLRPFLTRRLIQFIFKYSCPKPHFNVCQRDHKNSRVQKGDSRLPSKAFSDAAFIKVYLQILLSKAALPTVATASLKLDPIRASHVCRKDYKNSRVQNGDSRLPSKAFSDAAFIYVFLQMSLSKAALKKPR